MRVTEEVPRRPVFIFLDEGVPNISTEIEQWAAAFPGYSLRLIPFPENFCAIAIFDFQLVLFMRREIRKTYYHAKNFLYWTDFHPLFFFFTTDGNFVEDVKEGFAKTKKPERIKRGIKLDHKNTIIFTKIIPQPVEVSILLILAQEREKMIKNMMKLLSQAI